MRAARCQPQEACSDRWHGVVRVHAVVVRGWALDDNRNAYKNHTPSACSRFRQDDVCTPAMAHSSSGGGSCAGSSGWGGLVGTTMTTKKCMVIQLKCIQQHVPECRHVPPSALPETARGVREPSLVSMLHHLQEPCAAAAESRRRFGVSESAH
jgi:hypothetical protein